MEIVSDSDDLNEIFDSKQILLHFRDKLSHDIFIGFSDNFKLLRLPEHLNLFCKYFSPMVQNSLIKFWNIAGIIKIIYHRVQTYLYMLNSVFGQSLEKSRVRFLAEENVFVFV